MSRILRVLSTAIAMALVVTVFAACGSSVSQSNFDKIKDGMTEAEVESILGKPSDSGGGGLSAGGISISAGGKVWADGDRKITITFANGKVVSKLKSGF